MPIFCTYEMSKHIVELTCGDPKSNQQTASKVECVINVNNHPGKHPLPAQNIQAIDDTHVYESEVEGIEDCDIGIDVTENGVFLEDPVFKLWMNR